ncbi:OLC1v1012009C2 [Oldenlandia corymbosa var. corymbosa]|uniref:Ninja-family protein n=1 Tax=Oldenlandia corymbosa var. corymbosa TaxID=529605 RepID=A0AAV1DYF4_OLDCO|nr:OLC1v1012009C2 [Oldenlandia corymbosa var. corymbosa]
MAEEQPQQEQMLIDFDSDGYSSDSSLYSSSDMFGYDSGSSSDDEDGETTDEEEMQEMIEEAAELEAMRNAAKPDDAVSEEEFIQALLRETKGKAIMPEESPKRKKIADAMDLAAMGAGKNKGILIRENLGNASRSDDQEAAKKKVALSNVKILQDFSRDAGEFSRLGHFQSGHGDDGEVDLGNVVMQYLREHPPPPAKKARLATPVSLADYTRKLKPKPVEDDDAAVPNLTASDCGSIKSGLGMDMMEFMSKGEEFRNEMFAKVLVHLLKKMPVCTTRGGVPGGRLTKGFLFKHGPVEGSKIICTCHGEIFSTAEFVKHAGGREDILFPSRFIHLQFF